MFREIVLAAALAIASVPALAAEQDAQETAQQQAAAVQSYVGKLNVRLELQTEIGDVLTMLMRTMEEAEALAERKASRADVQRWEQSWRGPLKAEMASLEARAKALPPMEAADLVGRSPEQIRQELAIDPERRLGSLQMWESLQPLAERVDRLAPVAALGDEKALADLNLASLAGTRTAIEAENRNIRLELRTGDKTHPGTSLMQAALSANDAMLVVLELSERLMQDQDVDAKAYARRLETHADAIRSAADRTPRLAQISLGGMEAVIRPEEQELAEKVRRAFATYPEAAQIERDIAAAYARIAANLNDGDMEPEFAQPIQLIEPLIERRAASQIERNRILSN